MSNSRTGLQQQELMLGLGTISSHFQIFNHRLVFFRFQGRFLEHKYLLLFFTISNTCTIIMLFFFFLLKNEGFESPIIIIHFKGKFLSNFLCWSTHQWLNTYFIGFVPSQTRNRKPTFSSNTQLAKTCWPMETNPLKFYHH